LILYQEIFAKFLVRACDLSLMMTAISSYHWFYDITQGTVEMRMRSVWNFAENLLAQRYASTSILAVMCSSVYTSVRHTPVLSQNG